MEQRHQNEHQQLFDASHHTFETRATQIDANPGATLSSICARKNGREKSLITTSVPLTMRTSMNDE